MSNCKYHDIVLDLEARIAAGRRGARLPSLRALSAEYRVSTRTVGKAFAILRRSGRIRTGNHGTKIAAPRPVVSGLRTILLLQVAPLAASPGDAPCEGRPIGGLAKQLCSRIAKPGCRPVTLWAPSPGSPEYRHFGEDPALAGCIFLGTFDPVLANRLLRRGIPVVSANRLPDKAGFSWADWNHKEQFVAIVEHLVALGYRRLAYFHYLISPHLREHWQLIQRDFIAAGREFQLRNADLELFVPEHEWDCEEFMDFHLRQPRLPEVVIRVGDDLDDLLEAMRKRGVRPGRDLRVLLAKFAPGSTAVWAAAVMRLLERHIRNPFAAPRTLSPVPKMIYCWYPPEPEAGAGRSVKISR